MALTRRIDVFQDPTPDAEANMALTHHHIFNGPMFSDGNAQSSIAAHHDIIFNPPSSGSSGRSPLKAMRQPSTSPPKANISNVHVSLPPPPPPTFPTDSPLKRPAIDPFSVPSARPVTSMFGAFSCSSMGDKENQMPSFQNDNVAEFPGPSPENQSTSKRPSSSNLETVQNSRPKKARFEDPIQSQIPEAHTLPEVQDDGGKPQLSYASLIGIAILRSPDRKLTLAQIYKWISDSFAHYRRANDSGWQNSIRHNLSLNKAFIKQERPKDDPGKGNYWAIKPGCESQFFYKEKGSRRTPSSSGTSHKSSSVPPSSEANAIPGHSPVLTKPVLNTTIQDQPKEPSSDATIPASDAPSLADEDDEEEKIIPPPPMMHASSPLQEIASSPPALPELQSTPSPSSDLELPSLARVEKRKRKQTDIDDSGYFSCLDSSATRPYPEPKLPRLDSGRSKIKRGRAEEEIARMRSSSHEASPSRARAFMRQPTPSLISSSPLRPLDTALMPPPLTPAANLKVPLKPPPSVSPNTNLRIHRDKIKELVGSPVRHSLHDEPFYSPAFKLVDEEHEEYGNLPDSGFDIFDEDAHTAFRPATTSPKLSARHSAHTRTTSRVLADITGNSSMKGSVPASKIAAFESPLKSKISRSPLRFSSTVSDIPGEDLFGLDFLDDEEPDDFGGLDILQGFSKIGSNKSPGKPTSKPSRPGVGGRTHTSRF